MGNLRWWFDPRSKSLPQSPWMGSKLIQSGNKGGIYDLNEELEELQSKLEPLEEELEPLQEEFTELKNSFAAAEDKLNQCLAGNDGKSAGSPTGVLSK